MYFEFVSEIHKLVKSFVADGAFWENIIERDFVVKQVMQSAFESIKVALVMPAAQPLSCGRVLQEDCSVLI